MESEKTKIDFILQKKRTSFEFTAVNQMTIVDGGIIERIA